MEDLNTRSMLHNHKLAKMYSDIFCQDLRLNNNKIGMVVKLTR